MTDITVNIPLSDLPEVLPQPTIDTTIFVLINCWLL